MSEIHDMGGKKNFGPVKPEKDEPVFRARWEGRVRALTWLIYQFGYKGARVKDYRPAVERIPPADYLRISYYERVFTSLVDLLERSGLVTKAEKTAGHSTKRAPTDLTALTPEQALELFGRGRPRSDMPPPPARPPKFQVGQKVRARNLHPAGHTREPHYVRGKVGTIDRDIGAWPYPDSDVYDKGVNAQHVYTVRFSARELWGNQGGEHDNVFVSLWEDYLEHT